MKVVFLVGILSLTWLVSCARPTEDEQPQGGNGDEFGVREPGKECSSNSDCKEDQCCLFFMTNSMCWMKRTREDSCDPHEIRSCGCQNGLECRLYRQYNKQRYYRCIEPV